MHRILPFLVAAATLSAPAHAAVTFFHTDHTGSPVAATDSSGLLLWRAHYRPYGERETLPPAVPNDRWFTGHVHDDDTGLGYFGARYYDPVVGRFMGPDPAGFDPAMPALFNRYAYANGNPYNYVDPDGEMPLAAAGIGAVLGAGISIGGDLLNGRPVDVTNALAAAAQGAATALAPLRAAMLVRGAGLSAGGQRAAVLSLTGAYAAGAHLAANAAGGAINAAQGDDTSRQAAALVSAAEISGTALGAATGVRVSGLVAESVRERLLKKYVAPDTAGILAFLAGEAGGFAAGTSVTEATVTLEEVLD